MKNLSELRTNRSRASRVRRRVQAGLVIAMLVVAIHSPLQADVVVNPNNDGSTDVCFGAGQTLLTNPVADPLDLNLDSLFIGCDSKGELEISNGGFVSDGSGVIGNGALSTGLVTVDGIGSTWFNLFSLNVGALGAGTLNITNGGVVEGDFIGRDMTVRIGSGPNSIGTATVDGAGSMLIAGGLLVGDDGTGTLNVTNGAVVSSGDGLIGFLGQDSSGTVTVDGTGSQWNLNGNLFVGSLFSNADSFATLSITNGGLVAVDGDFTIRDNDSGGRPGTLNLLSGGRLRIGGAMILDGTFNFLGGTVILGGDRTFDGVDMQDEDALLASVGGVLSNGQMLQVEGQLNLLVPLKIHGGGLSAASIPNLAGVDFQTGLLELTGVDLDVSPTGPFGDTLALTTAQHLNITRIVRVATDGRVEVAGGRLGAGLFENSGVVTGNGRIDGRLVNTIDGVVRADLNQSLLFTGAGNTNRGQINVLGGTVEFEQDMTNTRTSRINGRGTFIFSGGLTSEGEMNFSGGLADIVGDVRLLAGSTVRVFGGGVTTFFDDVANNGDGIIVSDTSIAVFLGIVTGRGDYPGPGPVEFRDGFGPGRSAAQVIFGGDLVFGSTANLHIELAGDDNSDAENPQFDQLIVAGNALLDGTLDVTYLGGFTASPGDFFPIIEAGTLNGTFDAIQFPDGQGWFADYDTQAGTLTLRLGLTGDTNFDLLVNIIDLNAVRNNFGATGPDDGTLEGDAFPFDGLVNIVDLNGVRNNFGASAAAVPEPAAITLLFCGTILLFPNRWQRS